MNLKYAKKIIFITFGVLSINMLYSLNISTSAFPIYAQQGYENPREATGRIVCANCHLAQKEVSVEVPKSILPNTVFEAKVRIPYNESSKQILGTGTKGDLNVGAIIILPQGFTLAPKNLLSEELKTKTKNVYIQSYSASKENILVVGPIPGKNNQEITFPVLSPDPSKNKNTYFLKYPIYVGGNRGRGQIYPTGDKSNNNPINASYDGKIVEITGTSNGNYSINIQKENGETYTENIPKGLEIKVNKGNYVKANENLTSDPNVGGFGQNETEIVLQNPNRITGMITFFFMVTLAQIFFVLKKKQWEKVQSADMNF
uniref:Cytochrome f n=1 Tax=Caloglossa intermedia TaxID=100879 RepID=A0A1Z1M6S3_9FLOR|nr:Apocytochrome f [Caloglossa intermedia]ARW61465.1 Apocytochrome f [Caloglossa intermedia]